MKNSKFIAGLAFAAMLATNSYSQIVGINAYAIGDHVEIGVDEFGMEGTDDWAPYHSRGGGVASSYYGFVANPQLDGWVNYDGDFFTPGSPENGFGLDIDGVEYSNNAQGATWHQIPTTPGSLDWEETTNCIKISWAGLIAGIGIKVDYNLVKTATYYTTKVTMWNQGATTVSELYYYRNFDPDNNQTIGGGFSTNNAILEQPDGTCNKALVSAEQTSPWPSFVGLGAIDPDARVAYGGFSNRDGSELWNGIGFTIADGATGVGDVAIAISYKVTDFAPGDTTDFEFAVILDETQIDEAINSLYYIDYAGASLGAIDICNPVVDTAVTCSGYPVTLSVDGPDADGYDWTWSPSTGLSTTTGPTTEASPSGTITYTVTGVSTSGCTSEDISKEIVVALTDGPQAAYDDPGPQCGFFDINDLVWYDEAGVAGTVDGFFTVIPDSADQTGPLFTGPLMDESDVVYLMIGDTSTGCFSVILIDLTWGGTDAAGNDSIISMCNNVGSVDLDDLLSSDATSGGIWDEVTSSGEFNTSTAVFDPTGIPAGIYTFTYTVPGVMPCPDDVANFTVTVLPAPDAEFHYEILGESSDDGLNSGCLTNDVEFVDESSIGAPGVIDEWDWEFGDGNGSTATDPTYNYTPSGPDTYTITLTVTSTNGCVDSYELDLTMYENPVLDIISNDPNCYGFTDGSVTVNTSGGSGSFTIIITNEAGGVENPSGSNTANSLGTGWYYINVDDGTGCAGLDSVFLINPEPLVPEITIIDPLCFGDQTGMVIVDTVLNVQDLANNVLIYFWNPNPSGENGPDADTSTMLGAGDYTLTVSDSIHGCQGTLDFTITEPEELVFAELGIEPAYCRLYPYQSGNGIVFAAASGGTPDYTYEWEELSTGITTDNTTWGGRNPGEYQITVVDDNGCVLVQVITLDSLNPIAAFTPFGPNLDMAGEFCHGLVPIDISFSNESENFSNPNDPLTDTTFFWNYFGYGGNDSWWLTHEYEAIFDSSYSEKGTYTVCLVAQNKNGCTDTACTDIILCDPLIFEPVNVFTPDGDGINDIFTFDYHAQAVKDFHAVILDRWGVKIAEMNHITEGWNGTDKSGSTVTDGVYFYYYEGNAEDGSPFSGQGNVQVLKGGK